MPKGLEEVSGLAVSADGRLFAHDDEHGVVHELSAERPGAVGIRQSFTLAAGKKPIRGDFEGLAIAGSRFFLITSDGLLYGFREGRAGETVPFTVRDTRLADRCEIEGLATGPGDTLVAACKEPRSKKMRGVLTLFRLSLEGEVLSSIRIPLAKLGDSFHASGIDRDPRTGTYLVVASKERAIAEVTEEGGVVRTAKLPAGHPQAEGVAVLPDGRIAIADEGGRGSGVLTLHTRADLFGSR